MDNNLGNRIAVTILNFVRPQMTEAAISEALSTFPNVPLQLSHDGIPDGSSLDIWDQWSRTREAIETASRARRDVHALLLSQSQGIRAHVTSVLSSARVRWPNRPLLLLEEDQVVLETGPLWLKSVLDAGNFGVACLMTERWHGAEIDASRLTHYPEMWGVLISPRVRDAYLTLGTATTAQYETIATFLRMGSLTESGATPLARRLQRRLNTSLSNRHSADGALWYALCASGMTAVAPATTHLIDRPDRDGWGLNEGSRQISVPCPMHLSTAQRIYCERCERYLQRRRFLDGSIRSVGHNARVTAVRTLARSGLRRPSGRHGSWL